MSFLQQVHAAGDHKWKRLAEIPIDLLIKDSKKFQDKVKQENPKAQKISGVEMCINEKGEHWFSINVDGKFIYSENL